MGLKFEGVSYNLPGKIFVWIRGHLRVEKIEMPDEETDVYTLRNCLGHLACIICTVLTLKASLFSIEYIVFQMFCMLRISFVLTLSSSR